MTFWFTLEQMQEKDSQLKAVYLFLFPRSVRPVFISRVLVPHTRRVSMSGEEDL